jgi:membrane protease YdiL (CAAX protease family)
MTQKDPGDTSRKSIPSSLQICKEIILLFAVFFLPGYLSQAGEFDPSVFNSPFYHLQIIVISLPQILLLLYILEIEGSFDTNRWGLTRLEIKDIFFAIPIFLGLAVLMMVINIVTAYTAGRSGGEGVASLQWSFSNYRLIPLLLLTTMVNAYREELFYRFYLLGRLEQLGLNAAAAIGVSSILFSIGHIYQGLPGFLLALLTAFFLAGIYWKTRRFYAVAAAHGLYNFAALILSGLI